MVKYFAFLLALLYAATAQDDPCLKNKDCSSCLRSPQCGWLHGVQSTQTKGTCANYCVTKNINGTGPQASIFAEAYSQANTKFCVCKLMEQCGLWFTKECPACRAFTKCEDCLAQKGCNMLTEYPFNCKEYDFTHGNTTNSKEEVNKVKRQLERPIWVGNTCGSLCSLEYSFTNCSTCVVRKDLTKTGVKCGWCGEPDFSKEHDDIEECLPVIDGLPYGHKDRCAHGNASKWFINNEMCKPTPSPIVLPFPYLSIIFPGTIVLVFLLLVTIYLLRNKREERFLQLERQRLKKALTSHEKDCSSSDFFL
eukprot:TRINITY_DN13269_c0_g1_i1.p1 TRINITY_DN13269_c0_g1~~TRINITY_DN13269_c0_g1_i1.p1  ORF type:complete len:308 (+),score=44.21 TRINITY_DN13269_c0_g1_i1:116-1039(+)